MSYILRPYLSRGSPAATIRPLRRKSRRRHGRDGVRNSSISYRVPAPEVSLPTDLSIDEINLCLVFSNLLENAIQASVKTAPARRKINVEVYPHHNHLLLIHVENTFDGKIQQKNNIFQSSKRSGNGIGIESVRHITDKNGGACDFTYKDGIFSAKIMLRI